MDMNDTLCRYFGTADLTEAGVGALAAGTEKMLVDIGLETDSGKRFALWCVLFMLDAAPDLEETFADAVDRNAARDMMDMLSR